MDFYPFYKALIGEFPGFVVYLRGDGMFYDFVKTNNVERTRDTELSKYSLAYEMEDYGMSAQRKNGLEKLLEDIPVRTSYLDISCGRGETLLLADKLGYEHVRGTETVPALLNERVSHATLPSTGLQDKSYDVVSLIEVIEHLLADDVEPALHELTRLARRHILISAAVQDCWIGGLNLHPSAKPEEEWDELFRKVWNGRAYRVGSLGGSPAWRVDL
jgi:SAM-dependent methyltransferase